MEIKYDYDKLSLNDIVNGNKIVIPPFQRNVVWKKQKRKEFIDTITSGNPFGSILIYQDDDKYTLIDGLQRLSTIKDFYNNPCSYFDYKDINSEIVYKIVEHDFETKKMVISHDDAIVVSTCNEIQKFIFEEEKENKDWNDILFDTLEKFKIVNDRFISSCFRELDEEFNGKLNIDSLIVPAVIYRGPADELSNIFFHLNTGGVNLTKYETFSASWGSEKYPVRDKAIIDKIFEKYEKLEEESDLDVDISRDDLEKEGITIFEYCYAISELLRDQKYEIILGKRKKSTDPIGFEIISLICGLDVNKAELLYTKKLKDAPVTFLIDLKNMILETFDVIKESLEYWLKAKNNLYNTTDSMYMIYHIALAYIRNNYKVKIDLEKKEYIIKKEESKEWNRKFVKQLHLHYLKDTLSDYWNINRQVSDLMRLIQDSEQLDKYTKVITEEEWEKVLEDFKQNQLEEVTTTISLKSKLFIDYLIKFKIKENANLEKYFRFAPDYEHIVPKERIKKIIGKTSFKTFPVSSVGNICYLSYKDNRAKHMNTIYEFSEDRLSFEINKEYINLIDYPSKDKLYFIDADVESFKYSYRKYISNRIDELNKEFIKYIKMQ